MTLHTRIIGAGAPLVMLHGWGMHSGHLVPLAERLAQRRQVVLVDLPGHGASGWQPRQYADNALAGFASAVAEAMPDGATLLGWSLGGLIALELARRRSCRLASLVIVGGTPRFVAGDGWPQAIRGEDFAALRARLADDPVRCLDAFRVQSARGDTRASAVLRMLRRHCHPPQPDALRAGLDALEAGDLRGELHRIDLPALVVSGGRDRVTPPAAGRFLAAGLPRSRFCLVPDAAHAPFVGREPALAERIERFLSPLAERAPA